MEDEAEKEKERSKVVVGGKERKEEKEEDDNSSENGTRARKKSSNSDSNSSSRGSRSSSKSRRQTRTRRLLCGGGGEGGGKEGERGLGEKLAFVLAVQDYREWCRLEDEPLLAPPERKWAVAQAVYDEFLRGSGREGGREEEVERVLEEHAARLRARREGREARGGDGRRDGRRREGPRHEQAAGCSSFVE